MASQTSFEASTETGYMLSRDCAAASRLNLQYYLWKDTLGFDIHPSILSSTTSQTVHIADVGAGTAIWPIHIASQYPSARVQAYDIDCAQAPPSAWLPANLEVARLNVFDALAPGVEGTFDVVHVRLFALVVQKSDPRPVIATLRRLLKPGGYLQWDEVEQEGHYVAYGSLTVDPAMPRVQRLMDFIRADGKHAWVPRLGEVLADEGFVDAQTHRYTDREAMVQANSDQHMMTMQEFTGKLRDLGKGEDAQHVSGLVRDAVEELRLAQGAYVMPKLVTVARKSLAG